MALKTIYGSVRIEEIAWTVPVRTGIFQHLDIEMPADADAVVLMYMGRSGLVPYHLCLGHQVDPDKLAEAIRLNPEITQIVAVPVRRAEYVSLVEAFSRVTCERFEAERVVCRVEEEKDED